MPRNTKTAAADQAVLPYEVIQKLATLKRMDILIHVSAQDINRNLRRHIKNPPSPLDVFALGWRDHADTGRPDVYDRGHIVEQWRGLLKAAGMDTADAAELVSGPNNQPLYWLAFAARHARALEFLKRLGRLNPTRSKVCRSLMGECRSQKESRPWRLRRAHCYAR